MCGIVGFAGCNNLSEELLKGLERLEYRGYDSAGMAALTEDHIKCIKAQGRISALCERANGAFGKSYVGIAHTRWATHGVPSERNAHPHLSKDGKIALVHNGIIENHREIREEEEANGYAFLSDTDTEASLAYLYRIYDGNPEKAIAKLIGRLRGSFAFLILFADRKDCFYAIRRESPLAVALGRGMGIASSDPYCIAEYNDKAFYLPNNTFARVEKDALTFFDEKGNEIVLSPEVLPVRHVSSDKGSYAHFMEKETEEQPDAIRRTLSESFFPQDLLTPKRVLLSACGSAFHVCKAAERMISQLSGTEAFSEIASEFRYGRRRIYEGDLFIAVSQSGETADTLASLRYAKENGAATLGIVNVEGSAIARESDYVLYTKAGPEMAVATTKAYTAQMSLLAQLAVAMAKEQGKETEEFEKELAKLPALAEKCLALKDLCRQVAKSLKDAVSAYFIGRVYDSVTAMEGALKLKEISYIHAEAYAAGELKHGTISLIEKGTPVVAIATEKELVPKTLSSVIEVKARGGRIIAVVGESCSEFDGVADELIKIPDTLPFLSPILAVIPLQLTAYEVSLLRGCDPDKPRNLAKSVTVE